MLQNTIAAIRPLHAPAMEDCRLRIANLTKPLNSLGDFERLAVKLAGITCQSRPQAQQKSIILMAADHGVAAEGVSAYPQEVTAQMVANFCRGGAAINVFADHVGAELVLVDVGVAAELTHLPGLVRAKVAYGTDNIAQGPAMTPRQAEEAISVGMNVVRRQLDRGCRIIGLGEMGIANTTPSTAIIAAYSHCSIEFLTGRGTGLSADGLIYKQEIVRRALAVNQPDANQPLDVLTKVGGLEMAGLVGVILAAAAGRAAIVLDGLITCAAALIACRLAPLARDYLIGSHISMEPAHAEALRLMDIPAYLQLDMRLGEGTGAALGISLIDASLHMLNDMKTFDETMVAVAEDGPGVLKQRKTSGHGKDRN